MSHSGLKNPERYTLVRMVIGGWERIRVLMTFQLNYFTTFRSKYFATYAFWKLTGQNMVKNVYIRILFPISVIARSGWKFRGGLSACTHYDSVNLFHDLHVKVFGYLWRFQVIRSKYGSKRYTNVSSVISQNVDAFVNSKFNTASE